MDEVKNSFLDSSVCDILPILPSAALTLLVTSVRLLAAARTVSASESLNPPAPAEADECLVTPSKVVTSSPLVVSKSVMFLLPAFY